MAIHKDSIVDVDLTSGTIHRSFLNHSIGMNDSDGDFFGVRVFKGGAPVDLTNVSVQGHFNPPVGAPIFLNAGNYISGNVATVRLPQACYNYEGPFSLAIKLVTVNETVTVRIVDGMVDNTYVEGSVAPTGTVPTYQEVLAEYDQMVAATATANAAAQTAVNTANAAAQTAINTADTAAANCAAIVAAPYSNSATYAVGTYCTKDGKLYECTTAITTAEEWTAGHWTETKVGPEVSDLKSAIVVQETDTAKAMYDIGDYERSFTYTQVSGYQYFPIKLIAGTYYFTVNSSSDSVRLVDDSNTTIVSVQKTAFDKAYSITAEQASSIAKLSLNQGSVSITTKNGVMQGLVSTNRRCTYTDGIIDENTEDIIENVNLSELTTYGTNGYIDSTSGTFVSNQYYKVHYFTADNSFSIYHLAEDTSFCQIAVYKNTVFENALFVGSSSGSTLPDSNNRFTVVKGNVVAVCLARNITETESVKFAYAGIKDHRLGNAELSGIQTVSENQYTQIKALDLGNTTVYGTNGYINNDTGVFVSNANYKVYYFTSDKTFKIYYDGLYSDWLEIVVYKNTVFENKVYIGSSSRSTLPTSNSPFDVIPGNVVAICIGASVAEFSAVKISAPMLIAGRLDEDVDIALSKIVITKTNSTRFQIKVPDATHSKYCRYDFYKIYKKWDSLSYVDAGGQEQTASDIVSTDYWNNYYVYDSEGTYIVFGHSNFIVKVEGEAKHIGNGHGNEVLQVFQIIADGVIVDIDSMSNNESVSCETLRLVYVGDVYADGNETTDEGNDYLSNYPKLDTSGNPIVNFEHHMEITYEIGNIVTVENKLIVKQNNISFSQCHGAMLDCNYGDFVYAKLNNAEDTINQIASDGTASVVTPSTINISTTPIQKCNKVELYGGNFYVSQEMIKEMPSSNSEPRVHCQFYGSNNTLKFYFDPVIATYVQLTGESNEVFNTGDIIKVKDIRRINVK